MDGLFDEYQESPEGVAMKDWVRCTSEDNGRMKIVWIKMIMTI